MRDRKFVGLAPLAVMICSLLFLAQQTFTQAFGQAGTQAAAQAGRAPAQASGQVGAGQEPLVPATLDPAQKQMVDAALPKKAPAKPKKHRVILINSLMIKDGKPFRSPSYDTIPVLDYMMEQMGKQTGAYDVVISNDIEMFRPEKIKQFDAICFCNSSGVLFDDPDLRASLLAYVNNGGGVIGIHDAIATFVQWPKYDQWPVFGQIIGGTENGGHPWNMVPLAMKVEDPENPINAVFKGKGDIQFTGQVFQLQEPTFRDRLHVLMSIDVSKMGTVPIVRVNQARKTDLDFPASWIHRYGKGRVYYNEMGHDSAPFWNPALLQHYLAGIQYAVGDLQVDDSPNQTAPKP